jgi:hypothetical protein
MKLKRGTTREDGMIFWGYTKKDQQGEWWVTENKFNELKELLKSNRIKNKNTIILNRRKWRSKNKVKIKEYSKKYFPNYYNENKEKIVKRAVDWYNNNKDRAHERINLYLRKKRNSDKIFRLTDNIRSLIGGSFKNNGFKKDSKTIQILGCTIAEFKSHIESQFKDGMSWENRHLWHIDHIMPVSMAKTHDEVVRLNHYKNLRPLWAHENLSKSDKTPEILVLF